MRYGAVATIVFVGMVVAGAVWLTSGTGGAGSGANRPDRAAVESGDDSNPEDVLASVRSIVTSDTTIANAARDYYRSSDARLLWGSADSRSVGALVQATESAPAEGLWADEVDPSGIRDAIQRLDRSRGDSARAAAELDVSEEFLRLAALVGGGSAVREEVEVEWEMDADPAPDAEVLAQVATAGVDSALDALQPQHPVYDRMVSALERYRSLRDSAVTWPEIDSSAVAEPGDSAQVVAQVRARLAAGADPEERRLAQRGGEQAAVLDPSLAEGVAHYQGRHGVVVDSVIGPETVEMLNVSLEERIEQLRINLDRMRWLPRDFGAQAVLVNVAGFELQVLEENQPVLEMDVVVGQPEWRTRVFHDTIDHLVLNPYWHVPESIEAEETLPKVKDDPSYLRDTNMSVVPAGENYGEPVDPSSIDWGSATADMPYDFRQEPGPENALGQIKFIFPNRHNIYLHDTPQRAAFRRDFRAVSHGCIRLERPWDLARYVYRSSIDEDLSDMERIRSSRERTRVDLDRPIPVYLVYLTNWVDEDGEVAFHDDVYNRDARVDHRVEVEP